MASMISRMFPNLQDHLLNPAFYEPIIPCTRQRKLNRWCNFWNYLGARSPTPCTRQYFCVECGEPIKHKDKTYRVCRRHHVSYAKKVKAGLIAKPATFEVYAIA